MNCSLPWDFSRLWVIFCLLGWTVWPEAALRTGGFSGMAHLAAVPDQAMAEVGAFVGRDKCDHVLFDLVGMGLRREAQSRGQALDMGIDGYRRQSEGCSQKDIGGFSAHAGQRDQGLNISRDFSAKFFFNDYAQANNTLGFLPEKTQWTDNRFHLFLPGG
jgi:hypothetical protein